MNLLHLWDLLIHPSKLSPIPPTRITPPQTTSTQPQRSPPGDPIRSMFPKDPLRQGERITIRPPLKLSLRMAILPMYPEKPSRKLIQDVSILSDFYLSSLPLRSLVKHRANCLPHWCKLSPPASGQSDPPTIRQLQWGLGSLTTVIWWKPCFNAGWFLIWYAGY